MLRLVANTLVLVDVFYLFRHGLVLLNSKHGVEELGTSSNSFKHVLSHNWLIPSFVPD